MSYLVLARKFRPQTFASVIGQEHIAISLANAIVRDRVPHALLFAGPRGVGKTTSARIFAKALNCTGRKSGAELEGVTDEEARVAVEPCGTCSNCIEISRSSSLAVWEIDGASNNSVDNVRELIESLRSVPPPGSRYKIYIVDEVHMLSTAAFNAFLKSLEEPPPNTVFIFATTDPQRIPETVISRCQRFDFRRLATSVIVGSLRDIVSQENGETKKTVDDGALELVARKAQGGMRDAQSMLDRLLSLPDNRVTRQDAENVFGFVSFETFEELVEGVLSHDAPSCFAALDRLFIQAVDVRAFCADVIRYFRNLLVVSVSLAGKDRAAAEEKLGSILDMSDEELATVKRQAALADAFTFQRLFDIADRTVQSALTSQFPRFVFEAGFAKMATLESLRPIAEIVRSLEQTGGRTLSPGAGAVAVATAAASVTQAPAVSPSAPERGADFNPSWVDFVSYVVKEKSEPMLAAILRRVTPLHFSQGSLEISASSSDLNFLQDSEKVQTLRRALHAYSGFAHWKLNFQEAKPAAESRPPENVVARKTASPREAKREYVAGSVAALDAQKQLDYERQVEKEARELPAVKSAVDIFGAKVEKVAALKSEQNPK